MTPRLRSKFTIVFLKEFREHWRDRRSLMMLALFVLMYPLMLGYMMNHMIERATKPEREGMELAVIDICETAQRNLQNAFAEAQGLRERATAALMVHESQCLLTISANDEMFYTRRLEWDENVFGHQAEASREPGAATPAYGPGVLSQQTLESVDIVDYSVKVPEFGTAHDTPRLVIELQRSFDVWERSWPDLPLAHLTVHAGAGSASLASIIKRDLGLQVEPMDISTLFRGLDGEAVNAEVLEACVPLLGALLRHQVRKL